MCVCVRARARACARVCVTLVDRALPNFRHFDFVILNLRLDLNIVLLHLLLYLLLYFLLLLLCSISLLYQTKTMCLVFMFLIVLYVSSYR